MQRMSRPMIALAVSLALLAGYVDAFAFNAIGGFFASFMSGNSTRLGVGLGSETWADARLAGALILAFIFGVIVAAIAGRALPRWRMAAAMGVSTAALLLAAGLTMAFPGPMPLLLLAAAMGAENGVLARDGEISIGVTYFTGTLVRFSQKLAGALMGERDRWGWAPHGLLWLGFVAGVVGGTRSWIALGSHALWIAVGVAAGITLLLAALPAPGAEERGAR